MEVYQLCVYGVDRVDEDGGVIPAEMGQYSLEDWAAETVVVGAVAGREGYAICVEIVQCAVDSFDTGSGIEERGNCGEGAVVDRVFVAN